MSERDGYLKKVAVIGAGPAGMTAAYQISKQKEVEVTLFEISGSVGGLAKTITLWDQKVDIGPHRFFSSDSRVNEFWLEVVENQYEMVDRLTRIFYNDRFFYYPLKPLDAFAKLGVLETARCVFSYLKEKLSPTQFKGDFETWVTSRFGKRLFEVFFETYSEKLWGISCTELDADFAAQRIKKMSLKEAVKNAFFGGGAGKHQTLVDQDRRLGEGAKQPARQRQVQARLRFRLRFRRAGAAILCVYHYVDPFHQTV